MNRMISPIRKFIVFAFIIGLSQIIPAQQAPWYTPVKINDTTSWFGNTYNGSLVGNTNKSRLVQHFIDDIFVTPGGTVFSNATWEEHGSGVQQYKDGEWINDAWVGNHGGGNTVTANDQYIYFAGDKRRRGNEGIDRRNRSNIHNEDLNVHVDCGSKVHGLVAAGNKIYAAVPEQDSVKIYDRDLNFMGSWPLDDPHEMCMDDDSNLWIIQPSLKKIVRYDTTGTKLDQEITLADSIEPTDVCMDNDGRLLVADEGPNEQIRIYTDIATSPVLHSTFGVQKGVYAGVSGKFENMQFINPQGVGVDSAGNIYVASAPQHTTMLQSYTPGGSLNWELNCLAWIHCAAFHPDSEDTVYLPNKKFLMDFDKPVGQEWEPYSTIVDKNRFPDDQYRNTGGVFMRKLSNGKIYLYSVTQNGSDFSFYRFDHAQYDEISMPAGLLDNDVFWIDHNGNGFIEESEKESYPSGLRHRHFYVDRQGTIWAMTLRDGIFKYPLQGFTAEDVPIYSVAERQHFPMPEPFTELRRIMYFPHKDVMYLGGSTPEHQAQHWKPLGPNVVRYDNWHGERTQKWHLVLPYDTKENIVHTSYEASGMDVEGQYLFFVYKPVPKYNFKHGRVVVFDKETAEYVGYMEQPESWGKFGLPDMVQAINAYQRSNGEFLVIIEDDLKSKQVMYKWCPTGDCKESTMKITLTSPEEDTVLMTYHGIRLIPEITKDTATIARVEYYANNQLIAQVENAPYSFTLPDSSFGEVTLQAKLVGSTGAYKWSNKRHVTVSDGSPRVSLTAPEEGSSYNIIDTVLLSAEVFDYDGRVDSVQYYAGDTYIGSSATDSFPAKWSPETAGDHELFARAFDDSLKTGLSPGVTITAYGYREPDNPGETIQGLMMEYYEGNWDWLPDFSELTVIKKDTASYFNILTGREDHFAYRFNGYIQVPEKGTYTFYTASDDGSKLYIGDRLVVNNDGLHGTSEKSGRILLKAGLHQLKVTMFERTGGENLFVRYEGPGIDYQEVPSEVLFRPVGTAPSISVVQPLDDAIYNEGDTVTFDVSVSDPEHDVNKIEWYKDGNLLGHFVDTGMVLKTDTLSGGSYTITAKAYDLGGSVSTASAVHITINAAPEIRFDSPPNLSGFTSDETIDVHCTVKDENLKEVRFFVNGSLKRTMTQEPYSFSLQGLDRGTHFITATATDSNNLEVTAKIQIEVVNSPPAISIVQPDSGAVFKTGETITFKASVSDPDGDLYKVAFYQGNQQIGEDANMFHETKVKNLSEGNHTIVAKAYDKAGAVSVSDPIVITVGEGTGMKESESDNRLSVYPNPLFRGSLIVEAPGLFENSNECRVLVTDISGRVILSKTIYKPENMIKINPEGMLQEGMYILTVKTEKRALHKKIMITTIHPE